MIVAHIYFLALHNSSQLAQGLCIEGSFYLEILSGKTYFYPKCDHTLKQSYVLPIIQGGPDFLHDCPVVQCNSRVRNRHSPLNKRSLLKI